MPHRWGLVALFLLLLSPSSGSGNPFPDATPGEHIKRRHGRMKFPLHDDRWSARSNRSPSAEDDHWWSGFGLPVPNRDVLCAVEFDGGIAIGGRFSIVGDVAARNVAHWDGTRWRSLGAGLNLDVTGLAVHEGNLIAVGHFNEAGGMSTRGLARWDGWAWSPMNAGLEGMPLALATQDGSLLVGGAFALPGGTGSFGLARWNGSSWTQFGGPV